MDCHQCLLAVVVVVVVVAAAAAAAAATAAAVIAIVIAEGAVFAEISLLELNQVNLSFNLLLH